MSEQQARHLVSVLNEKQKRDLLLMVKILQEGKPEVERGAAHE